MQNEYEFGSQKVIPATLVYLFFQQQVLLVHRTAKNTDIHLGKLNGLGGKCEFGESFREAVRREVREEAGLDFTLDRFRGCGVLQFPNFKSELNQDWIVAVFYLEITEVEKEKIFKQNTEGQLSWYPIQNLLTQQQNRFWDGDLIFLPYVFEKRSFFGTFWYQNKKLTRHDLQVLN